LAAVLAFGAGALLSHRSAAALLGIGPDARLITDVIAPRRVRLPGIAAHRHVLHPYDVTVRGGLPTTTVSRTLLDLGDVLTRTQHEHAFDTARVTGILSLSALEWTLARGRGRAGTAALRRMAAAPAGRTRSAFEAAFLKLIRAHGLPEPIRNGKVNGREVDFHWPQHRLIVRRTAS
jgi:hypothetical protein